MKALFTAQMVVLVFVLVRSIIRAVFYGVVALLALIAVILTLL